ncbi:hypothetical protein [Argonema galeatum]|uniref:hypothetical protein n=1 Tax=Argonema galeatum TaxID=2942762 RepID=UPI00201128FE|nr:hypothetical protein [Argonema galeatum]MCL1466038.1 hypothetical protein [Argonema galeatum A003/A1]
MELFKLSETATLLGTIEPPLTEQWCVMALPSNSGWVSIELPDKSPLIYPLRPGAIFAIAAEYEGKIVGKLGAVGTPLPTTGAVIFFSNEEYAEVEAYVGTVSISG